MGPSREVSGRICEVHMQKKTKGSVGVEAEVGEGTHSREYQNGCRGAMLWQLKKQTNKQKKKEYRAGAPSPIFTRTSEEPRAPALTAAVQVSQQLPQEGAGMFHGQLPTTNRHLPTANSQPLTSPAQQPPAGGLPSLPDLQTPASPSGQPGLQGSRTFCSPPE